MSLTSKLTEKVVECSEAIFDCTDPTPHCRNSKGFDFQTLWNITLSYWGKCPNGPWLFKQLGATGPISSDVVSLTNDVCKAIAGPGRTKYPASDIWYRLTTWKFPLFQLIATSPRPPMSFFVEAFTVVHLLGDPIGTIADLLRKIDGCQSRAIFWQGRLDNELAFMGDRKSRQEKERQWKSLAIIIDSYDEWGLEVGDNAESYLSGELSRLHTLGPSPDICSQFLEICLKTADTLAADRSTTFLPIVVAQGFFISSVAIAMIRTQSLSAGPHPSTYIDIEMYSIAFTALFFWVIFTVILTSIIGASQTAEAIPRILERFHDSLANLAKEFPNMVTMPPKTKLEKVERVYCGGIYSWQPGRTWKLADHNSSLEQLNSRHPQNVTTKIDHYLLLPLLRIWPVVHFFLPLIIVSAAAVTGQAISALVPPVGWSCRSGGELWIFLTWVGSYLVSYFPFGSHNNARFWATFGKDLICIGVTMGIVIDVQVGDYNRCDCYTKNGLIGLTLPEMPAVKRVLETRLVNMYPAVMALGIAFQLVIVPGLLLWRYQAAVKVFLQRDDGKSNLEWWHRFKDWHRGPAYLRGIDLDRPTTIKSAPRVT